ncbi:carbohydrate kinase family protein [Carboxylicivirga linearis]|uniref:Carbohydrate kinase n=1 Tax=Carboxylicivirga linearis TaxID=1628157 RepID=A0ABS5JW72_9BACT|nr:carbohydrate kinase [Carboxylicivirga linearis]MBS2099035.1 carbohydrate kinase [Carboxylicivirga linearis]
MRRVFGLGETVMDMIFKDNQPVAAKAGGSALNTMVSLARTNVSSYFISEVGTDRLGQMIMDFLEENQLHTDYICRFNKGKSALALAFLNDDNDAEYEFFKDYPKQRLVGEIPEFTPGDILIFGSYFGLNPVIRPRLLEYLQKAKSAGAIIIYDPNFRSHHLENRELLIPIIEENLQIADLVRGSDEDFENIYGTTNPKEVYAKVAQHCTNLIITANKNGVYAFGENHYRHYMVPVIEPISTIGAGDNFNAGMIKAFLDFNIIKSKDLYLSKEDWMHMAAYGIEFSAEVCMRIDNYIHSDFSKKLHDKVQKRIETIN